MFCGGKIFNSRKVLSDVKYFSANNFNEVINLPNMKEARSKFSAFCIKGEVYVFGGNNYNGIIKSVEKYSPDSNTWQYINNMIDDRKLLSACSFMENVYIIGGLIN